VKLARVPFILSDDSDLYPIGPYPYGGGESDVPQHCDHCGAFLENPLTQDGLEYVQSALAHHFWNPDRGAADVLAQWAEFYSDAVPSEAIDCGTEDQFGAYLYGTEARGEFAFRRFCGDVTISTPGSFEAEPPDILFLYDLYMNGDNGILDFADGGEGVVWYDLTDAAPGEEQTIQILGFPTADNGATAADGTPLLARYARLSNDTQGFWYLAYYSHDAGLAAMAADEQAYSDNEIGD